MVPQVNVKVSSPVRVRAQQQYDVHTPCEYTLQSILEVFSALGTVGGANPCNSVPMSAT